MGVEDVNYSIHPTSPAPPLLSLVRKKANGMLVLDSPEAQAFLDSVSIPQK
jgi:hypothetical protein